MRQNPIGYEASPPLKIPRGELATRARTAIHLESDGFRCAENWSILAGPTASRHPFRKTAISDLRNSSRRSRPGVVVGGWSIGRTRAHTRSHARRLNLLARGSLVSPDASFLRRQRCPRVRTPDTRPVTSLFTVATRIVASTIVVRRWAGPLLTRLPKLTHGFDDFFGFDSRNSLFLLSPVFVTPL